MEGFDFFAFLDGASPWWWVAFAVAIGAIEMLTFSYFLIWIAAAALATGAVLWAAPGLSGADQLLIFAIIALTVTAGGRFWLAKTRATPSDAPSLNRRSEQVIGRTGKAMRDFEQGEGTVEIDGVRWRAKLVGGDAPAGAPLTVIDADGMQLICEPR